MPQRAITRTALIRRTLAPAGSYSQIGECRKSRENASFPAWAQGVAGSNPGAPPTFLGSFPDTWVTVHSEHIGNTFGPNGLSIGSSRHVSSSKKPKSYSLKGTGQTGSPPS